MKKIQRSNSIKEANAKSGNRFEKGKNQPVETMSSAVIKKYDELIRCTNVLTEGIESGELTNLTIFTFDNIALSQMLILYIY